MAVDPGFRADHVVALHLAIPRSKYSTDQAMAAFYTRIIDRVRSLPGVVSAAMVNRVPLAGNDFVMAVTFDGIEGGPRTIQSRSATPDYFTTIGIPLREGRVFTEHDSGKAPLVGIIDERLAASLWRNDTAIGKSFKVALPGQQPASGHIVGVVGNIRHQRLDNDDDRQIYFNYHQFTDGRSALIVRSQSDVRAIVPAVVQTIHDLDPEQPVYDVATLDDVLVRSAAERWLGTAIVGTFATCAILLAGVGLYGVIAYGVTQRGREFGLRIALGAAPSRIARQVLIEGLMLAGTGAAIGVCAAVGLSRGMRNALYGVTALDPVSVAGTTAALLVVTIIASYLPARRAALSAPAEALRGA